MHISGDPHEDVDRLIERHERWLLLRPRCAECHEPITDSECYEINCELICAGCLEAYHQKVRGGVCDECDCEDDIFYEFDDHSVCTECIKEYSRNTSDYED